MLTFPPGRSAAPASRPITQPVTRPATHSVTQSVARPVPRAGSAASRVDDELAASSFAAENDRVADFHMLVAARRGRRRIIQLEEIVWLQAAGNYVRVHTRDGAYLVRVPLRQLERSLGRRGFVRAHRSALVPTREMLELEGSAAGPSTLVLRSGARIPVSREFRRWLERSAPYEPVASWGIGARGAEKS